MIILRISIFYENTRADHCTAISQGLFGRGKGQEGIVEDGMNK